MSVHIWHSFESTEKKNCIRFDIKNNEEMSRFARQENRLIVFTVNRLCLDKPPTLPKSCSNSVHNLIKDLN